MVTTLLRQRSGMACFAAAQDRGLASPGDIGRHDGGVDLLRTAYRTAHRLRAAPTMESITGELHRLDVQPAPAGAGRLLTAREEQVLRLVGEGLTPKEIGTRLFLSVRTVEMHVRNAVAHLGC